MPTLPSEYLNLIQVFVPLFSKLIWRHAQMLLLGAILTPGQRTVTSALRIIGPSLEPTRSLPGGWSDCPVH